MRITLLLSNNREPRTTVKILKSMTGFTVALGLLICSAHVNAAYVSVESDTDNNGSFTYSVTKNPESYTLGGSDGLLSLTLKAYHVIDVTSPAGWTWTNTGAQTYTWICTNAALSIIGSTPLVFGLESASILSYTFNNPDYSSLYPQGTIAGEIYMDGSIPFMYPTEDNVAAVNVAALERFTYTGPILPEPTLALLLPCFLLSLTFRKM